MLHTIFNSFALYYLLGFALGSTTMWLHSKTHVYVMVVNLVGGQSIISVFSSKKAADRTAANIGSAAVVNVRMVPLRRFAVDIPAALINNQVKPKET